MPDKDPMDANEQVIGILGILAEGVRYKILTLIASRGEITAKEILPEFGFTQPTLSHHMACLKEAGLVNCERRGRFIYYSINQATVDHVVSELSSLLGPSGSVTDSFEPVEDAVKEPKKGKKKKKDKLKKKKKD